MTTVQRSICVSVEKKLIAHNTAFQNNVSVPVDAMELEYIFRDVHAEGLYSHFRSPS